MLLLYILFEFVYYLYYKVFIYGVLNKTCYRTIRGIVSKDISSEIYTRFKEYIINEEYLIKYFMDAIPNREMITIENIKKLLSYHIYNTYPNDNIVDDDRINELVDIIKDKLGSLIRPNVHISDTNDFISYHFMTNRLNAVHKPFIFYIFMYFIRRCFNFYMYTLGFTNIVDPHLNLRVWIKHNSVGTNKMPLVFIHGFGFGIMPYIRKILRLSVDRRTVIVPEFPNISYDLYKFPPPSSDNLSTSLYNILIKQNIELIDIAGHSFGGLLLNTFQNKYPHICNYKTYAESPVFCIHQSHIVNVIAIKIPFKLPLKHIIKYIRTMIIYNDIYTQYFLNRCLFYENTLIKNLDDKTTIILAKDDRLVPSYYIHKYITAYYPQVQVEMIEGDHAAYIFG